ncbi:amino acid adenylation domain-containing protein [Methylobacterium sp. EM32]|uniref:non-ribosomal peptide synthetase/type I polyketide synthase n=1 Tax=Methylobacterium sp. EM32 TaxID=3163481 RepID=UPI0033A91386
MNSEPMGACLAGSTLCEALAASATAEAGIVFVAARRRTTRLSYADLLDQARRRGGDFLRQGVRPGDEVIIATDNQRVFVVAFWACLLNGFVAVPVAAPANDEGALKLARIWTVLARPWLVADGPVAERVAPLLDRFEPEARTRLDSLAARILATPDSSLDGEPAPVRPAAPDDVAFIQFSSGSTGAPKGVTVTHANLLANCDGIWRDIGAAAETHRFVSWMPLTHDFGIIWFHILPVVRGLEHGLIPTKLFVRSPIVWLQAASDLRATVLGGPNFSYRHLLKFWEPDRPRDWDLSAVRIIVNGAEPIAVDLAAEFVAALAPFGLGADVMTPAYGLAEGTLAVTLTPWHAPLRRVALDRRRVSPGDAVVEVAPGSPDAVTFVSVGAAVAHVALRIADEAGAVCGDGVVGRIQIRGASVTAGYYRDPAATRAVIAADGWLDTGDLGFTRYGELVMTGRRKDILIVNGVNYYPQDIERVVGGIDGLDLNMAVAGAVPMTEGGSEREGVAVFVLHRRDAADFAPLARRIRDRVLREIGIPVDIVVPVSRIPKTTSGKVQRFDLVRRYRAGDFAAALAAMAAAEAGDDEGEGLRESWRRGDRPALVAALAALAHRLVPGDAPDPERPLMEGGLTSLRLVELVRRLNRALGLDLPVTLVFEQPSLAALADALLAREPAPRADAQPAPTAGRSRIVIAGLACRLPGGVETPEAFWDLLAAGRDATGPVAPGRWPDFDKSLVATDRGGYLADIETFPHRFFNLTQVEAELVDPQQRLLLMTAWEAVERAGLDPQGLKGSRTGVFVGIGPGDYVQAQARSGRLAEIGPHAVLGSTPSVAAGRIAYVLGLEGPVLAIDTACSSALAALHLAVRALRAGECERAIVAGVNLILGPELHVGLSRMKALSPHGRCRAFDAGADGYARGEGCVALVLARADAVPAGRALAIIAGSAVSHDGASNGLTAPNGAAQRAVIAAALADAGLTPDAVDYVEAHGTGTPLGDPIEAMALAEAYGAGRTEPLPIGSVKTNLGHLEAASGLAGLAKVVLALRHGSLPASLHFAAPNPLIPWSRLPLEVVAAERPWPEAEGRPRRAAVSAFGMSGTNAHVIVEDVIVEDLIVEEGAPAGGTDRPALLALSARTPDELRALSMRYAETLAGADASRLHDLAATAALARAAFPHRLAVVGREPAAVAEALRSRAVPDSAPSERPRLVFLLPGQGAQSPAALRHVYDHEPAFRAAIDAADRALAGRLDHRLADLLTREDAAAFLARTAYDQPASVAVSLAMAAVLRSCGVEPDAVVGHSVGEIAAAAIAGLLDPDDAVRFAADRGAAMQLLAPGAMLAVQAPESVVQAVAARTGAAIAARNAPSRTTLAGSEAALAAAEAMLRQQGARVSRLDVAHAFHSPLIAGALPEIRALAAGLDWRRIRGRRDGPVMISTLTGAPVDTDALRDPEHWAEQACAPVAFADALAAAGEGILLDLGSRPVLAPLAAEARPRARILAISDARRPDERILDTIAALFEAGAPVRWRGVFAGRPGRVADAPTTPFLGRTRVLPSSRPEPAPAAPESDESSAAKLSSAMPQPARSPAPVCESDGEEVARTIRSILKGLAGLRPEEVVPGVNWFGLGLDSLLIVQLQQALGRHYAIDLPLAEVMEHGDTLERLVALVVPRLARPAVPAAPAAAAPAAPISVMQAPAAQAPAAVASAGVEGLLARQIDAMSALFQQQIQLIQGGAPVQPAPVPAAPVPEPVREAASAERTPAREIKGLFKALPGRRKEVDPAQGAHVARLTAAYNARTRASKDHTARHRGVYANPRAVIGFRPEWKELTYPLHVERAAGAHVWDLDGHRYVDITMGFGVTLFGHNPDFVRVALEAEIAAGYPVGPQTARAGRVAALIRRMTGVERVAFFTTGSEAVMVALRLARAKTGRRRIAIFTNSYHGTFDGLLASGWSDGARATTLPVSDGTPQGMVEDVIVLRYGDPEALDTLRHHAADLAAIVVEPVQSRDPSVQPRDFLHALRALTLESGTALIFDETITGFRVHPGGAQAHFGVTADIVTYGKVVGGGLPIGVVSGRAHYLDAVDGGDWQYGDDSGPTARTAFVAGTFNNHPLTMAAAEAVLTRLESEGPALQERLNARTMALCAELNALFAEEEVPIRMVQFSSLFRFEFSGDTEILNYHLLNEGVFVWEGRNCFLSAAHDEADLRHIVEAVRRGLAAMRADGWLPPRGTGRPRQLEKQVEKQAENFAETPPVEDLSLSRGQGEMRALIEARPESSLAYNEMVALALDGPLDEAALGAALRALAERHEALRCIGLDDRAWYSAAALAPVLTTEPVSDDDAAVTARLARDLGTPFDLENGPLLRALLLRRGAQRHVLALTVHHIVADGWSLGLMATELAELYAAAREGRPAALPPATSFRAFVAWSRRQAADETSFDAAEPVLLPAPPGPRRASFRGGRIHRRLTGAEADLYGRAKRFAQGQGVSPFTVLLGAYALLLGRLSDQRRLTIGVPVAGHTEAAMPVMVGPASAILPVTVALSPGTSFTALVAQLRATLAGQQRAAASLLTPGGRRGPDVTVLFNLDRGFRLAFDGLALAWLSPPVAHPKKDLFLNLLELNGEALIDLDYDGEVADAATARRWLASYLALLDSALRDPDAPLAGLSLSPEDVAAQGRIGETRTRDGFGAPAGIGVLAPVEIRRDGAWHPTGRLGRLRADGSIEDLGPRDRFARGRAGWIDLQATATVLAEHPALREAVVVADDHSRRACVTARGAAPDPRALAAYAALRLVPAARPDAIVVVDAIPRRADGSPDRAALAAIPAAPAAAVPPRGEDETRIARIWADLLGLDAVGATDSFFDLGGHSLKALAMLARIERETGRSVSLRAFFEAPTVAGLAARLDRGAGRAPIPRHSGPGPVPASNAQARLWMLDRIDPGLTAYTIGFALCSPAPLDATALRAALHRLGSRHESLRTALTERDGLPVQTVLPEPLLVLHEEDVAGLDPEAIAGRMRALAAEPFDLAAAPLWRAAWLRGAADGDRLVVLIHHAISDVWSLGILVRDVLALYGAAMRGVPDRLPALPLQYRDYAAWAASRPDSHLAYWTGRLAGAPRTELRPDHPRPAVKTFAGDHVTVDVPVATAAALKALAAIHGASAFAGTVAALYGLVWVETGSRDIVLGTVTAGRDHPALADQIGFFVNTLALRAVLDPEAGFTAVLGTARDALMGALAHGDTPLDRVVEALGLPRDPSRNPLFEIVVVMDDRDGIGRVLGASGFGLEEIDTPTAQFDLTLYVTECADASLRIKATYNTDLFTRARIAALMERLVRLMTAAAADPEAPVKAIAGGEAADGPEAPTPHQERLWFVDRFERGVLYPAGPTYYNMPAIVRVADGLDPARLAEAAARLAARHPVLRSAIATRDERPVVISHAGAVPPVTLIEAAPGTALAALEEASRVSFDLGEAPLARLTLCRETNSDTAQWLALTVHHALADPASLARLLRELETLYRDPQGSLPPAPGFKAWAARERDSADPAQAAAWRDRLAGVAALVLPTDRPRPAIHTYTAGATGGTLALAGIDRLAEALGVTRADILGAGYHALLHRLSGQDDVIVGETWRPDAAREVVGPATNLLPLRLRVDGAESFADLVRRRAGEAAAARAQGALPFDRIVLAVKPRNDMSRTALFDVLFHYAEPEAGAWEPVETGLGWGKYDLVLSVAGGDKEATTRLVFNRDLFDQETGRRIHDRFAQLLAAALAAPDRPLADLDLMLPGERAALLVRASTIAEYPRTLTLVSAFAAVAARHGSRKAVTDAGGDVTYADLDRDSERLARHLLARGAAPDRCIGLLVERSRSIPLGLLGILKAGSGYLPLDPAYPEERCRFMVADSGAALIVADARHADLARRLGAEVVVLEEAVADEPPAGVDLPAVRPEHLACVIYTSGSTGTPKGCMIEHRNVVQLLFHDGLPFAFVPDDVWTLFHSACFDFSTWEIYGALLFGGRLVVVPQATAREPDSFLDLLAREGVTVLNQTPTAFYALIEAARQRSDLRLRLREIVFGGEALQPGRLGPWRDLHPQARLVNMYGITETTVHVTFREIGAAEIADGRSVIGGPLPSYGVLLVGPDLGLCPEGIAGEILVSGHGVARGYLGRPELTAERFVAHPDLPGQRLYRSGDLGRLGPDGGLVYLGRIDDQVKVRGFRIELGEIERRLVAHPRIRDAAVTADGDALTAYLVADGPVGREALVHDLADRLPDYMIPARFLRVPAIPLTPNGKADRRRLAVEGGAGLEAEAGVVPRTPLQRAVARIWGEVLSLPEIGLEDNFFTLGGHSLKANQAVVRLRQRLGARLDLRDFFSAQTLAVLADLIERRGLDPAGGLAPAPDAPDHALSFAQRRMWLLQAMEPGEVAYNMVGALLVDGPADLDALARAFAALVERHEILRTRFVLRQGEPRQVVDPAPESGLVLLRDAGGAGAVDRLLNAEFRHVFDLAAGGLVRVHLVAASGGHPAAIVLNLHHIVADGWSVTVMLRDLAVLYRAALAALGADPLATADLPPLRIQFKDFAAWQQEQVAGPSLAASRAYWLSRFEDEAPPLALPADRPRPPRGRRAGAIVPLPLGAALSRDLRDLARRHDASLFALLAAMVRVQLALLSGQDDVTIGTPVAGRNLLELEDQIGFYLNLLALRGSVAPDDTMRDVLRAERALVLDAFAHDAYPFDLLVEDLARPPEPGRQPLFDVLLILQNNEPVVLDLAGSTARPLTDTSISAKYDLNYMVEGEDELTLLLEYAANLFDPGTARSIAEDFATLARAAAADLSVTVGQLGLLVRRDAPIPGILAAAHGAEAVDHADGW